MTSAAVIILIRRAVESAVEDGSIRSSGSLKILLERARQEKFGDYATNVAMLLASGNSMPPRRIAEIIADHVEKDGIIQKAEVAGPGFINIFMRRSYWLNFLNEAVSAGDSYGRVDEGKGKRTLVEFVSANPTGPLHIGHGRGAAYGDSLSSLLDFAGFAVTREFYINDAGSQMRNLAESIKMRMKEESGERVEWGGDMYRGEYITRLALECLQAGRGGESDIGRHALSEIMGWIRRDLGDFNVAFDNWFSERDLYKKGKVKHLIKRLKKDDLIEERDGALWFRSASFGDDKDRVVVRKNGDPTYFASDIAYHDDKFRRGFELLVNVWGADHHGYIPRIRAVIIAMGLGSESLKVPLVQMVTVLRGGRPVIMSKRAGEYITLRDVLDEVGPDATRFFFLMRKSDAQMDFDIDLAKKQAPENPVYYVQYAHARITGIVEFAASKGFSVLDDKSTDLAPLKLQEEMRIIKKVALFPDMIRGAAVSYEPHRITFYLQELAGLFHPYYNRNRIVTEDVALTAARILLCRAVGIVLKNGLRIIGVSAPKKM